MGLIRKTLKAKENFADNHGHNILRLFDVLANSFSLQVKQSAITSHKHIYQLPYELPHKLPHELSIKILRD